MSRSAKQPAGGVVLSGTDRVVIELDDRHQFVGAGDVRRLGYGGEIVARLFVGARAVQRGQPVVGITPHNGMQIEPLGGRIALQQTARHEIAEVGIGSVPMVRQFLEYLLMHGTAEACNAAEEFLPRRERAAAPQHAIEQRLRLSADAVIGLLQNVILTLYEIAADVQPPGGGDVAGLMNVADDPSGQDAQAER